MRSDIRICLGLLALVITGTTPALPATTTNSLFPASVAQKLNREIGNIAQRNNLPSVAVDVFVPGKGEYSFVTGLADLKRKIPRTLDQPFRIASITKPFAATAVLVLVDRGLLRKTDTIARWYPAFPNAKRITIDNLLRMRSGIPSPDDDAVLARVYDAPLAPAPSLAEDLRSYTRLRSEFKEPNTETVYSDFNYDILAGIVERVTGRDMGAIMTDLVIKPLKLRSTLYPTGTSIPGPLRGYGWNRASRRFDDKTLFNPPLAGASGAVISSVSDLRGFAKAVCTGTLLKPKTQRERMQGKPFVGSATEYGEGIALGDGFCGHSGTINGFSTDMYYVSNLRASIIISVNRLDRDNKIQSTPIYALLAKTLLSERRTAL